MNVELVRKQAADLVGRYAEDQRILVLGATGWLGSTAVALLDCARELGYRVQVPTLTASTHRLANVAGRERPVLSVWDPQILNSNASLVLNFAFMTRGWEMRLGPHLYTSRNLELIGRFLQLAAQPSVRSALTMSSGAALQAPEGAQHDSGAYGLLKQFEESEALKLTTPDRAISVARAWSVSGALAHPVEAYAFSGMIRQGLAGRITVQARNRVFRRYCGADDFLAICIADAVSGRGGILDSGGPLVEMRELANAIARTIPTEPAVDFFDPSGESSTYASDGHDWLDACARHNFHPAGLDEQIQFVVNALSS